MNINLFYFYCNLFNITSLYNQNSPKATFFHKSKVFDMCLMLGLSSQFGHNMALFRKIVMKLLYLPKIDQKILYDCFSVRFVPISENCETFKMTKIWENRTNVDIILLFLAKLLDKHGISLTCSSLTTEM